MTDELAIRVKLTIRGVDYGQDILIDQAGNLEEQLNTMFKHIKKETLRLIHSEV